MLRDYEIKDAFSSAIKRYPLGYYFVTTLEFVH